MDADLCNLERRVVKSSRVRQDEQRELAKTIRVSGSILLSTVSNFLDFFKMETGKQLDIVRTEIDLHVRLISLCVLHTCLPCVYLKFLCLY